MHISHLVARSDDGCGTSILILSNFHHTYTRTLTSSLLHLGSDYWRLYRIPFSTAILVTINLGEEGRVKAGKGKKTGRSIWNIEEGSDTIYWRKQLYIEPGL